jgi:hypothetical protein
VAPYSSRGPVRNTFEIKPDVVAPGSYFNPYTSSVEEGTSYAAPYVSGSIVLIKQKSPFWGPHEMKSALASTAIQLRDGDEVISPIAQGSGLINVRDALFSFTMLSPVHLSIYMNEMSAISSKNLEITNLSTQEEIYDLKYTSDDLEGNRYIDITLPGKITLPGEAKEEVPLTAELISNIGLPPATDLQGSGTIHITTSEQRWHVPLIIGLSTPPIIELNGFNFKKKTLTLRVNYNKVFLVIKLGRIVNGQPVLMNEVRYPIPKGEQTMNIQDSTTQLMNTLFKKSAGRELIPIDSEFIIGISAEIQGTEWKQYIGSYNFYFRSGQVQFREHHFQEIKQPTIPRIEYPS